MIRTFGISVEDMLDMEVMKGAKLLAGKKGINKKVTKMNVMEVPDIIHWVSGGEFLLTTAYSIKDKPTQVLMDLIPQLNMKGLAGIGIKMKRYIDELPEEIIQLANKLGFPIIEIPYNVSYTEIMMPVLTKVINNQADVLLKVDEIHNKLIDVMIRGGSLEKITESIADCIGNTVAIKDSIFDTVVISSPNSIIKQIHEMIEGDTSEDFLIESKHSSEKYKSYTDNIGGKDVNRLVYTIYRENRLFGYLYIWEDKKKMNPIELTAIESAIPIIILDLVKKISIIEIESRHKIEFLDELLSKDEKRHKKAIDRCALFDFDHKLAYGVMVIKVVNIKEFVKETFNDSNFLYQVNSKLLQMVERLSRSNGLKTIVGNKTDEIIVLYGTDKNKPWIETKTEFINFTKEILKNADFQLKGTKISVGLGRFYNSPSKLWKSYAEAVKSSSKYKADDSSTLQHYDELGIYRILSFEESEEEMLRFYKEILMPLVEYDNVKDSELVKTLQMYFMYSGNLKRISKEMYTHYNTIIYRMQRIREITDLDLDDPEDKLCLQMALKIYEIIK